MSIAEKAGAIASPVPRAASTARFVIAIRYGYGYITMIQQHRSRLLAYNAEKLKRFACKT